MFWLRSASCYGRPEGLSVISGTTLNLYHRQRYMDNYRLFEKVAQLGTLKAYTAERI